MSKIFFDHVVHLAFLEVGKFFNHSMWFDRTNFRVFLDFIFHIFFFFFGHTFANHPEVNDMSQKVIESCSDGACRPLFVP